MKYLILIFIPFLLIAQPIQNKHKSVISRLNVEAGGGGAYIPDIVYVDTSNTGSAGAQTLTFDHWGSIASGHTIFLFLFKELSAVDDQWGTGADTVNEAGWNFYTCKTITSGDAAPDISIGVFYKIATGSESGSFTVQAAESDEQCGFYVVMDSVNSSNVVNAIGDTTGVRGGENASEIVVDSTVTTANNCLAVGLVNVRGTGNFNETPDTLYASAGWSIESPYVPFGTYLVAANRISPYNAGGVIAIKDMVTAGTTGFLTLTYGFPEDTGNDGAIGFIIAIEGINP